MKIKKEELGMAQFFQKILSMVKTEKTHRYSALASNRGASGPDGSTVLCRPFMQLINLLFPF